MTAGERQNQMDAASVVAGTLSRAGRWLRAAACAATLAWCLMAAFAAFQNAQRRSSNPIAELDAEFSALADHLPPRGIIGFLERYEEAGSEDAARTWYVAQYALSPRVVVSRLGPEYLIVARGAAHPDGDPRLEGYVHVTTVPGGHQLFRRLSS